jgi:hypothetical protein
MATVADSAHVLQSHATAAATQVLNLIQPNAAPATAQTPRTVAVVTGTWDRVSVQAINPTQELINFTINDAIIKAGVPEDQMENFTADKIRSLARSAPVQEVYCISFNNIYLIGLLAGGFYTFWY